MHRVGVFGMLKPAVAAERAYGAASTISVVAVVLGVLGAIGGVILAFLPTEGLCNDVSSDGLSCYGYEQTHDLVAYGIGVAVASVLYAVFVYMLTAYIKMRSSMVVHEEADRVERAARAELAAAALTGNVTDEEAALERWRAGLNAGQLAFMRGNPPGDIAPGWKPDPFRMTTHERWWTGESWTGSTRER